MNGSIQSSFLVDTNIVIGLFRAEAGAEEKFNTNASSIALSVIVLGELIYGAKYSARSSENLQLIRDFQSECQLITIDEETVSQYAEIKLQLRQKGQPIPENDVWIAATALRHEFVLVTRDRHFDVVNELSIEVW